jgi:TolB protein
VKAAAQPGNPALFSVLVRETIVFGIRVRYGAIGLAVIAFSVIGCSLASLPFPEVSATQQKRSTDLIAYMGSDGNIYTVDPSGVSNTALTDDAQPVPDASGAVRYYSDPSWSPKGDNLAFMEVENGPDSGTRFSVWVRAEGDAGARALFSSPNRAPIYLYWSPDGTQLSFITSDSPGGPLALHLIPIDGSPGRVIDSGQPYYWSWSPTGQAIVAHVGGSATDDPDVARLSLISLGPEVTRSMWDLAPLSFQAPAYSPDGSSVLLAARTEAGRSGLLRVTAADGQVETVLSDDESPVAFAWSPSGTAIATMTFDPSDPSGLGSLSFLQLGPSGEARKVDTEADRVVAFFWSPDGNELAYFVPVLPGTNGGGTNISLKSQSSVSLKLAIADPHDGSSRDVTTFKPTSDFLRILPFFDQYLRSTTIWSPDSRNLAIPAYDAAGKAKIFIVPADSSGEPNPIGEGTLAFWSWE